jgi:cytochrome b6
MSRSDEQPDRKSFAFVPQFVLREAIVWVAAVAVLALLAVLLPWPVGEKADPLAPAPAGIKPEWYFVFMFQTLRLIPSHVFGLEGERLGIIGFMVAALVLLLVPLLDRDDQKARARRIAVIVGVLAIVYMIVMTVVGYRVT